jgi:MFS family permease
VGSVLLVVLVVMAGLGMAFPIVPLYARSFGVSLAAVGAFIATYGASRLVFDLVGGALIDRWGERIVTVVGLTVMSGASLVTAWAGTFGAAVAAWAVGGAGSAVVIGALYSYLLRVAPKAEMARTFGLFYGAFNVGIIAGGPVGGLLAHSAGLRAPFVAYAAALAAAALLYYLLVGPPPAAPNDTPADGRRSRGPRRGLFASRGFLVACAANLAYLWMIAAVFDTLVPLLARESLGMSAAGIGVLFAVATATELAVLYPAGILADRRGRRAVLLPSLAALAGMVAALGWASSPVALAVLLGVLGLASGSAGVPPGAMLSDVSPPEGSGVAVGVFRFFGDLGLVAGPLVAGTVADVLEFRAAFAVSALPIVLACGIAAWGPETLVRSDGDAAPDPPQRSAARRDGA